MKRVKQLSIHYNFKNLTNRTLNSFNLVFSNRSGIFSKQIIPEQSIIFALQYYNAYKQLLEKQINNSDVIFKSKLSYDKTTKKFKISIYQKDYKDFSIIGIDREKFLDIINSIFQEIIKHINSFNKNRNIKKQDSFSCCPGGVYVD